MFPVLLIVGMQCAEWSLSLMTSGSQRLRELERAAKQQRVGMWVNYVPPPTNQVRRLMLVGHEHRSLHALAQEVICLILRAGARRRGRRHSDSGSDGTHAKLCRSHLLCVAARAARRPSCPTASRAA